jgi:hypothetical protein
MLNPQGIDTVHRELVYIHVVYSETSLNQPALGPKNRAGL